MEDNKEIIRNKVESEYDTYLTDEQLKNIDELLLKIDSQKIMPETNKNIEVLKTLKKEVNNSNSTQINQNKIL